MKRYGKFIAQVVATVLTAVVAATAGDGQIDASEAGNVIIAGLGAIAVLGAGNLPSGIWAYTKTIVAGATAGAMAWQSALGDGITTAEWWQIAVTVLGALGVLAAPGPKVYDAAAAARAGANLRPGPAV
jgi:hypothetical protein